MTKTYTTRGTCSKAIKIDTDGNMIKRVEYVGGCHGNTQGVARLAEGRPISEVIPLIKNIKCGFKPTSCPDQLAKALEEILSEEKAGK